MTNLIVVFARLFGVPAVLGGLVGRVLKEQGLSQVVDLGTGSGGSMPEVVELLRTDPAHTETTLELTDLYPNQQAVARFNDGARPWLRYRPDSVDATDLATAPPGLKTMINCFHHMSPPMARKILSSARSSGQPLLIYEMADNQKAPFWLWALFLPIALPLVGLMAVFMTPLVHPLTFRQVFFTFPIPLIPLFYAWDGQASFPRIYNRRDLDGLLEGLQGPDYHWEKGIARDARGKEKGLYLLGLPVRSETATS